MKPLRQYFRMVLFVVCTILTLESVDEILHDGVTIQMWSLKQYFHMLLFVLYVVLIFEACAWHSVVWPFNWNLTEG